MSLWRELQRQQFGLADLPGRDDPWGKHVDKLVKHMHNVDRRCGSVWRPGDKIHCLAARRVVCAPGGKYMPLMNW